MFRSRTVWIKAAILATGISGLVAEFILSTLASYFIGDTVVQWTLVLSIMLFSMGLGSHSSKRVKRHLLTTFVLIEISLSLLIGLAPLLVYAVAGYWQYIHLLVYGLAALTGFCIGFEIPLATRLNEDFADLKENVSSILAWDYVGSLIGGLAFAFLGLPVLGLKNTAFLVGGLNLLAAMVLFVSYWNFSGQRKWWLGGSGVLAAGILALFFTQSGAITQYGEQKRYKDKIVFAKESAYQKLVVTTWLGHHWLYINGNLQLSTIDAFMYHEPMAHPVMHLCKERSHLLVIGGGDGLLVKELLKYVDVQQITVVDLDPAMTDLGAQFGPMVAANDSAFHDPKVQVLNQDGFVFLQQSEAFYDAILLDLPDAKGIDLNKLYSKEFYQMAYRHLRPNGHLITQAGSPYYATKAFACIENSVGAAGFHTLALHNQVMSMGEWGWVIGSRRWTSEQMKAQLAQPDWEPVETQWFTPQVLPLLTTFGKPLADTAGVGINTINDPVLYRYQLNGTWKNY